MIGRFLSTAWKILKDALKGFVEDHCYLHASSLTYYTMLSVVPLMAVTLGIAQGFGFADTYQDQMLERFYEHKEVVIKVFEFARSLLQEVQDSMIASVSAIVLFIFVLLLFWTIESTFNIIWKVHKARTWARKVSDYFTLMVLCPIFFVAASSFTVYFTQQLQTAMTGTVIGKALNPMIVLGYRLFPFFLVWVLFTLLYLIMPNTRVHFSSAVIASVIAGTVYQFVQWVYITFQIGVSQYSAVYGSFAALPLFLIWLQFSWIIVLIGAEIAYHLELQFRQRAPHA